MTGSRTDRTATYPSLRDKVVFVTGGSTGIGATFVEGFARQGAKVGFCDIDAASAQTLQAKLSASAHRPFFTPCDVTDIAALKSAIAATSDACGDIDVLINNVANDQRHDISEIDQSFFDWEVSVNLRPHVFAIQSVLPGMKRQGGGSIINMGSISWMNKNSKIPIYAALKSASVGLTRSLSKALGRDNIRINHLAPGWTITERQARLWLDAAGEKAIAEGQCLPGKVMPEDIVAMALFLAADDSKMITAQDFIVDGGWV